jgi:hypothetical protein
MCLCVHLGFLLTISAWRSSAETRVFAKSAYIIAWKLCTTMRANDVTDTLELALAASGRDRARVVYKPLLSDNGSSDISSDLAEWLKDRGMVNIRGAPCHPQTQGKIEHQDLVPLLVAGVPPETRLPAAIRACWARLFREAVSYQSDPERDGHVWVGILLNTVHFLRYYADSRGTKEAGNGSKTTSA